MMVTIPKRHRLVVNSEAGKHWRKSHRLVVTFEAGRLISRKWAINLLPDRQVMIHLVVIFEAGIALLITLLLNQNE
jgi:hypothetical protein